jgi:hypothetical protein
VTRFRALVLCYRNRDRFAIPRVDIYRSDGQLNVALKTSVAYRPVQTLLTALRSSTGAGDL